VTAALIEFVKFHCLQIGCLKLLLYSTELSIYWEDWHSLQLPILRITTTQLINNIQETIIIIIIKFKWIKSSITNKQIAWLIQCNSILFRSYLFYLYVRFLLTAVAVFQKPDAIRLCFSTDLVLNSLLSWLLVLLRSYLTY